MAVADAASLALGEQLRHWRALLRDGHQRVGWKLAFGIEAIEAVRGERPLLGYLTSASRIADGGLYELPPDFGGLRFEAELAVRVAERLDASADERAIGAAMDGVAVALEVVDVGQPQDELMPVVENNVLHKAFVLGDPLPVREHDRSVTAISAIDGREARRTTATPPLVSGLREAALLLEANGEALEPGDWLITGSMAQTACVPGTEASVSISGLGRLAVQIAAPARAPGRH